MNVRINKNEPNAAQRLCEKQLEEDGINVQELMKE